MLTFVLAVTGTSATPAVTIASGATVRVSVATDGTQSNSQSFYPSISGDGRYVAFDSWANNLVPGDTNFADDVFVYDGMTAETTRVSLTSDGTEGEFWSQWPSISADGRYIAFTSASSLVPGDTNFAYDVFVYDQITGEISSVSVSSDGEQGNNHSYSASISTDGRYVTFSSRASNLVPDDTNPQIDIFVRDRTTGETTRVSVATDGTEANADSWTQSISGDGRFVAFQSYANNLVPGDTNECNYPPGPGFCSDVFLHDRVTGETTVVSAASDGTHGNERSDSPSISADGRYVAFSSRASNLVPDDTNDVSDVFVYDRMTGETSRVSVASDGTQGNGWSSANSISRDGRYVAFTSYANNLVAGDTNAWDVFVRDRTTGETTRVSVAADGTQGNDVSGSPSISADGRYVAFVSPASNLVLEDTNGEADVFVHDRTPEYGVNLSGQSWQLGTPGAPVTYTLLLSNTGALTDTYALALSGSSWTSTIESSMTVVLAPGAGSEVIVVVLVPEGATAGRSHVVTLTVASQQGLYVRHSVDLATTIRGDFITNLPLVFRRGAATRR